ncbi:hypothetical protein [Streptosporangium sp. V21-05]|uniref:hypothetical protein n=1 Tax=Streptosporangium sp. V21-05 TaxID=3446115 RepID=UPI003F533660
MERARQLAGEMLIYCFVIVLLTGGFLAFFHTPGNEIVYYDGSYTPLHGVPMSAAYRSAFEISHEVRGGLLVRQAHHSSSVLLVLGAVVWTLLGGFRYVFALLGLGAVLVVSSRREAARHPRTPRFVALGFGLTVLMIFFL